MAHANLTELELSALRPDIVNLSDGHARQLPGKATHARLRDVFERGLTRRPDAYFEAEHEFLTALSRHTGQSYGPRSTVVTYASSVAMGVVAIYLRRSGRRVGVIRPAFDNIPGILRSMDVPLVPVPERYLAPEPDLDRLDALSLGALVVVVPNNPTGRRPDPAAMQRLLDWAAARDVHLVVDLAFRWFDDSGRGDLVRAAEARGADLLTIDDTGKVLSLSDLKAGVLTATNRLVGPIRAVHTEYVLNVSELGLRLLTAMLARGGDDEVERARQLVLRNRNCLSTSLAGLVKDDGELPGMSVAWLRVPDHRDRVVAGCRARGVEILPGDRFDWAGRPAGTHVRVALLRDPDYFARGAEVVAGVLHELL
jgi:aspartate/methionine/tyrosine aminotransferase